MPSGTGVAFFFSVCYSSAIKSPGRLLPMNAASVMKTDPTPRPFQGVGESGRPRVVRTDEIGGSNPPALTIPRIDWSTEPSPFCPPPSFYRTTTG